MNTPVLQGADHFEAGAVADVTESLEGVPPKRSLQDVAITGAVKQRAPLLQLMDPLWSLLRMNLGHAPVVQKLAAAHRVAEVRAPIIGPIYVGHRGRNSAFSHDSVGLTE